ncbi:uncharacterized protein LOC143462851 isoform X2 [Clavelina lepadiformis]|uniref:uncharacterized protein LOC143462851 isoform X2 n=1 Tax=Clavelina lepadiformis TaxID=159417 RepID=UPI004041481F
MLKAIVYITSLLSVGLVSAMEPRKLSDEDIARLTELANTVASDTRDKIYSPTSLKVGPGCIRHTDCKSTWTCEDIPAALNDVMRYTTHENDVINLRRKAKIEGKECIRPIAEVLNAHPKDAVADRIVELINKLNTIMENADVEKYQQVYPNVSEILQVSAKYEVSSLSLARASEVAPYDTFSNIFLILALRGNDGDVSLDAETLILLSLLQTQQPSGSTTPVDFGSNIFNNPILLFLLLGDSGGSSSNILLLLLLSQGGGGLFPTSNVPRQGDVAFGSNNLLLPLILLTALDGSGTGSDNTLLLLFLTSGGFGGAGTGTGTGIESLLPILLLSDSDILNGDDNLLLLLLLSGGLGGGTGGGIESILPLLLLSNSSLGGGLGGDDNLLLLLLLSGGLGGGGGGYGTGTGTGIESLLPILLLSGDGGLGGDDNLLLLLLLSGGLGGGAGTGGIESILPLLLLSNSSLGGGLGGGDDNLLLLLLLSGGLGGGGGYGTGTGTGTGGIDPLLLILLLGDGLGSGTNDLLPILLLSGGLGGGSGDINSILPLLLITQSGDNDILPLLFLTGFFQSTPVGQDPFAIQG